jgi:hypothetical protein
VSRNAEILRELREKAKAKGYCWVCRARPDKPGRSNCQHCLDLQKAKKARWRSEGRCVSCCKPHDRGTHHCVECTRARAARFGEKKAASGTCWRCRYPAAEGYSMCLPCKEKQRVAALKRNPAQKVYHCRVCGQVGHNARSCGFATRAAAP